jgi:RNA polymerase sigma factor (sigma-70 family)
MPPESSRPEPTVFIVDDDAAVRDSLALLLGLKGYRTACFASAEAFLSVYRSGEPGCLLLDVRMPGMGGLELQALLAERGDRLPVIVITAHGDVPMARAVLKAGAEDFIEKPIDDETLLRTLGSVLEREGQRQEAAARATRLGERIGLLTERERQVMELVAEGRHNREIGEQLGISPRTVEVYKARMMDKLQISGLPELVRFLIESRPPA